MPIKSNLSNYDPLFFSRGIASCLRGIMNVVSETAGSQFFFLFFGHIVARVEAEPEVEFYSINTGLSYHLTSVKHEPMKTRMPLAHLHCAGRIWGAGGTRSENKINKKKAVQEERRSQKEKKGNTRTF